LYCTSNYKDKLAYFNSVRAGAAEKSSELSGKEQALKFLNGAAKHGRSTLEAENDMLSKSRDSGALAKSTTDVEIDRYSEEVSYMAHATSITNNAPTRQGMAFLRKQVDMVQHEKGSTFTDKHGSMRTYGGSSAAKQRASNTRLQNPVSLHNMADSDDLDKLDDSLGRKMKEAVNGFDPDHVNQAVQNSLLMNQPELEQMTQIAAAKQESINSASFNANLRGTMGPDGNLHAPVVAYQPIYQFGAAAASHGGGVGGGATFGTSPPHSLPPLTPYLTGKMQHQPTTNERHPDIGEVRDEAMLEIVSDATTRGPALQGVVEAFSRPRDQQMVRVNTLLVSKGQSTMERLDKLVKFEQNRRDSKKD
jgi:hypothetical protein